MPYPRGSRRRAVDNQAVPSQPSFPELEEGVLAYWGDDKTFEASVEARDAGVNGSNEFVFYDGPPFANGLPHYGHLLTGYVKDVVPRYQTMRGRRVERRFGWDCHGLPAEVEAEKQLGITHKTEIEAMGVAKFNDACRASVLRYTDEWESYVTRQARWVDFDHDYKTLDLAYMESVMWAFKTLWDKGLIYEGFRVLWYCWRCETPLSNTETKMDDVYRDRQDPAVTVGLRLQSPMPELDGRRSAGLDDDAVDAAVEPRGRGASGRRVRRRAGRERRALPARARPAWPRTRASSASRPTVLATFTGAQLVGTRYTPPFDFFAGSKPNAHQVLPADYVTTEDGTGMVHIAPAFGEEDKAVTDAAGIEPVTPVELARQVHAQVPPYEGKHVFEANKPIISDLKDVGRAAAPRHVSAPVPALLALRHSADPARGHLVVRRGHDVPRPHGRAEPADHLGARAHQGRPVRQVAGERARLVDLAQPLLGLADPGVDLGRPEVSARGRLRLARRAGARLRRRA